MMPSVSSGIVRRRRHPSTRQSSLPVRLAFKRGTVTAGARTDIEASTKIYLLLIGVINAWQYCRGREVNDGRGQSNQSTNNGHSNARMPSDRGPRSPPTPWGYSIGVDRSSLGPLQALPFVIFTWSWLQFAA